MAGITETLELRELMRAAHIGPVNLARELGVTRGAVDQWITGATTPTAENQDAICAILNRRMAENEQLARHYRGKIRPRNIWQITT